MILDVLIYQGYTYTSLMSMLTE